MILHRCSKKGKNNSSCSSSVSISSTLYYSKLHLLSPAIVVFSFKHLETSTISSSLKETVPRLKKSQISRPSPLHHSSPASLAAWSSERFSSTGELKHLHQTKDKEKNLCPSLAGCFIQALMHSSRMHGSSSQCSSTWQHTCHECFVYVCSQQGDIRPPPPSPQDNNNKTGNNNKNFLHTSI